MFTIYLAGYISGEKMEECSGWRKKLRNTYDNWKSDEKPLLSLLAKKEDNRYPICWLDPLNGKEFATITPDGLKSSVPGTALVSRDYWCVRNSNLLIVNLDTFGSERPLTGTIYEMAWAWEFKIPVIAIRGANHYNVHPFIEDTVKIYVDSVEQLIEEKWVNYFFKGTASAIY